MDKEEYISTIGHPTKIKPNSGKKETFERNISEKISQEDDNFVEELDLKNRKYLPTVKQLEGKPSSSFNDSLADVSMPSYVASQHNFQKKPAGIKLDKMANTTGQFNLIDGNKKTIESKTIDTEFIQDYKIMEALNESIEKPPEFHGSPSFLKEGEEDGHVENSIAEIIYKSKQATKDETKALQVYTPQDEEQPKQQEEFVNAAILKIEDTQQAPQNQSQDELPQVQEIEQVEEIVGKKRRPKKKKSTAKPKAFTEEDHEKISEKAPEEIDPQKDRKPQKQDTMEEVFEQQRRKVQANSLVGIPGKSFANTKQSTLIPEGIVVKTPEEIEQERLEQLEIERQGDSLWLTDQFVDRPLKVIGVGAVGIFFFVILCLAFQTYWPSPVTVRDLLDYQDIHTQIFDAREAAYGEIQTKSSPTGQIPLQSVVDSNWQLVIGVECIPEDCDNILTPSGIQFIKEIDEYINNDPIWKKICLIDSVSNQTCMDNPSIGYRTSKASILIPFKMAFGEDLQEMTQFGIDFALFGLAREEELFNYAMPLFSSEFNRVNRKAKMVRLVLTMAGPIQLDGTRFNNMRDRQETQEFMIANWQAKLSDKLIEMQQEKYPDFRVHAFGRSFYYRVFYRQLVIDVLWSGLAAWFVYLYVFFHIKSFFVSTFAMAQILFSFPITLVIYKLFMGITNISPLHLMIVFLVLGISADNIFVIWDAWVQSDAYPQFTGNLKKRMAYTFRRAAKAILATSSTTAFAFLSNGFSTLMPVSAFGYFAFVIVPVNYLLIVCYFPAFLILYETKVKQKEQVVGNCCRSVFCCQKRKKNVMVDIQEIEMYDERGIIIKAMMQENPSDKEILRQQEYFNYMQQYYAIKQKELELGTKLSSFKDSYNLYEPENKVTIKAENFRKITPNSGVSRGSSYRNRVIQEIATLSDIEEEEKDEKEGGELTFPDMQDFGPPSPEDGKIKDGLNSPQVKKRQIENQSDKSIVLKKLEMHEMRRPSISDYVAGTSNKLVTLDNDEEAVRQSDATQDAIVKAPDIGRLEKFFDGYWNDQVHKFRWPIIIFGILMASYASFRSLEIRGLSRMEEYFPPNHIYQISLLKNFYGFNEGGVPLGITVDIMWGIEGINKDGVDYYNASDIGSVIWDNEFDITLGDNQQEAYNFCQYIKMSDMLYREKLIVCWIDDFKDWLESESIGESFPVRGIRSKNTNYVFLPQRDNFYKLLNKWISTTKKGKDHVTANNIGLIDGKLVFMKFTAQSKGAPFDPYVIKKPNWEAWDRKIEMYNLQSSKGINKALQTAGLDWCFAIMEIRLVQTMIQGLQISIGFALIAIFCATLNIVQAFLASLTIGLIIVNVMAIVAYMKWELGSGESVGVVVCVGFAVDYVVHLASHFIHSKHYSRHDRIRESLRELGGSILSGSMTTIGATIVLFICVLVLFHKFAIFVIATILFSVFYSLAFFAAMCHVIGPQGKFGSAKSCVEIILNLYHKIVQR